MKDLENIMSEKITQRSKLNYEITHLRESILMLNKFKKENKKSLKK